MYKNNSLSSVRTAEYDVYDNDLDGLFSFIGKIGKGVLKVGKGVFKGGKQIQQAQTAIDAAQGIGPYAFGQQGYAGRNSAAQFPPPQQWSNPNKLPSWVIPAGIAGVGILAVVLLTRKK